MGVPKKYGRATRQPREGDIVAFSVPEVGWLFGRVASTEARFDPDGLGWSGLIVLYIFCHTRAEPCPPNPLLVSDLLLPPLIVDSEPWTRGFFAKVGSRSFGPGEKLPLHCFMDKTFTTPRYFDEYANEIAERVEPCGDRSLTTLLGIERTVRQHLQLCESSSGPQRPFAVSAPRGADHCVTLYLPLDTAAVDCEVEMLERELANAVELARVGEWSGHGTDLESGTFDIQFVGKDCEKLLDAMRPVLERWRTRLPTGWHLTDHTDYTDPREIRL